MARRDTRRGGISAPSTERAEVAESKLRAIGEVAVATLAYIGVSLGAVRLVDVSRALTWLTAEEAAVVSGFLVGSLSQVAAVALLWLVLRPVDLASALGSLQRKSTAEGWYIALTVIAVEMIVIYGFFLDVGWRALKPSPLNVTGSLAPLLDGVTQEVFFRGYLIVRLARGGHGRLAQLLVSSLAFSAIHVGYVGAGWANAVLPMLGTLGLGMALGWAFIRSGRSLRPPVVAHVTILLAIQPWLALAR